MIIRLPGKTFADYAAIAICPVLIMLVVGSLIFFLLAIGYAGSHLRELQWTFFWFVLAMVLVSRIAIEKGSEHAGIYGLALAAVTAFRLLQYIALNLWMWLLLALIWWAANKLTWDCTVIDDDQDASGEGLLRAAKLDSQKAQKGPVLQSPTEPKAAEFFDQKPAKRESPKVRWWERGLEKKPAREKQPHAPGRWIIYFSLGALPIFGLGQGLIPSQDVATRRYGFGLLAVYLAAVLGLLLVTSFLGLRRYLRQRQLEMPAAMAATWLTTGASIAAAILAGCLLLPRPNAQWSLTAMVARLGDPVSKAVQRKGSLEKPSHEGSPAKAVGQGETTGQKSIAQPGTSSNETAEAGEPAQSRDPTSSSGTNRAQAGPATEGGTSGAGKQQATAQNRDQSEAGQGSGGGTEARESASSSPPASQFPGRSLLKLVRIAIYVALVALGLFVLIKQRERLLKALQEFWRSLLDSWRSLFAREAKVVTGGASPAAAAPRHSFSSLSNPFASGAAAQMPLDELVIQTFNGLEAWAEDHDCGRHTDQTPFEFAERVANEVPELATEADQVTRLYVQVAYAKAAALPACRTMLEILWSKMTQATSHTPEPT